MIPMRVLKAFGSSSGSSIFHASSSRLPAGAGPSSKAPPSGLVLSPDLLVMKLRPEALLPLLLLPFLEQHGLDSLKAPNSIVLKTGLALARVREQTTKRCGLTLLPPTMRCRSPSLSKLMTSGSSSSASSSKPPLPPVKASDGSTADVDLLCGLGRWLCRKDLIWTVPLVEMVDFDLKVGGGGGAGVVVAADVVVVAMLLCL